MLFGNGKPRPRAARRSGAFRPAGGEILEGRVVPVSNINLIDITGANGIGPFGVEMAGTTPQSGGGFSVAEVGDVNGDGFDDFVIGSPTVRPTTAFPGTNVGYILGNGSGATAFLVLGSNDAVAGNVDWLTLTTQQRVGDLASVGNPNQTNPANPNVAGSFNFNGLTLTTGLNPTSGLGASVKALGDINGDGVDDFIIGAPGANNNSGQAYIVFGSPALGTRRSKTVDLDNPQNNPDVSIETFRIGATAAAASNARVGAAVSSAGNFFGTGLPGVAIGAPNASVNGGSNNGAVFVIPNGLISPAPPTGVGTTIDLSTIGQPGGAGVIFSGANDGDEAGFSVTDTGSVDGRTSGGVGIGDLLIGAPAFNPFNNPTAPADTGPGAAYLIYGGNNLSGAVQTVGLQTVPLGRVGVTGTTGVPGAIFNGQAQGDLTGFSVSTAGDFNGDGLADILIGSPGFSTAALTGAGRASLIEGRRATSTSGAILGTFNLSTLPSTIQSITFVGGATGNLAGFSVSAVSNMNNDALNEILIGAPGALNSAGRVYLIPGNANLRGTQSLLNPTVAPILATVIANSFIPTGIPTIFNFLGASVSGRLFLNGQGRTADTDRLGDFAIGSSGFTLNTGRQLAGAAFLMEGGLIGLATPSSAAVGFTVPIGVNAPAGPGPFPVDVTTATTIQIHVDSVPATATTPAFRPVTDIDPTMIVVNGMAFPTATVTPAPTDENGDGIPDAIITIGPVSNLNLVNGLSTLTLSGTTTASAQNPNAAFTGTTTIQVTGGVTPPPINGGLPGSVSVSPTFGFPLSNATGSRIGERLVPQIQTLSQIRWKPLPVHVAFHQFLPSPAYRLRHAQFFDPDLHISNVTPSNKLPARVFNRGRFKRNKPPGVIHHHVRNTIPPTIF